MPQKKQERILEGFSCILTRSGRKTLQISVEQDGVLTVRAPYRMPQYAIAAFLRQKKGWICAQQAKAASRLAAHPPHTFRPGDALCFLGEPLHMMQKDGDFFPYREKGALFLSSARPGETQAVEWFRQQAKRLLPPQVEALAKTYGFSCSGVRITSAKGRYGSCNGKNGINLSWRILMAPPQTVEAILLHELCHTKEHNHSARFWELLRAVCPDYAARCRWLAEHGLELVSFG